MAKAHEILDVRFDEEMWEGLMNDRPYQIVRLAQRLVSRIHQLKGPLRLPEDLAKRDVIIEAISHLYETASRLRHPLAMNLLAQFALSIGDNAKAHACLERADESEEAQVILVFLGVGKTKAEELWGSKAVEEVMVTDLHGWSNVLTWWDLADRARRLDIGDATKKLDRAFRQCCPSGGFMQSTLLLMALVGERDDVLRKYYADNDEKLASKWEAKLKEDAKRERDEWKWEGDLEKTVERARR